MNSEKIGLNWFGRLQKLLELPKHLVVVACLGLVVDHVYAETIHWVDFLSYPAGQLQANGLTSADGLEVDVSFSNTQNMRSGAPSGASAIIDDPQWPFKNDVISALFIISSGSSTLTTTLGFDCVSLGGLPAGGSIGVVDLELIGTSATFLGFRNGSMVPVNWDVSYFQTADVDMPQPAWNPELNRLTGTIPQGQNHPSENNFVFLTTDVQLDAVQIEIVGAPGDGIEFAVAKTSVDAPSSTTIENSFVFHNSWSASSLSESVDASKIVTKEESKPQTLSYDNLINTAQGINGLGFDFIGWSTPPFQEADLRFQWSPQGTFDPDDNPPANWETAPAPTEFEYVLDTVPLRVFFKWPDNSIVNRWLRVTIRATENTGLAQDEVFYIGHLLGETTGESDGVYSVAFQDISLIRSEVGNTVDASSIADIDKNGSVTFADINAMRVGIGAQLTNITIPASGE